jgi:Tfp pilus assembly protein PilF
MRKAMQKLPGNVSIRLTAAQAYEEAGIFYKAVEEYRRALIIDPNNRRAKRGLGKLIEK